MGMQDWLAILTQSGTLPSPAPVQTDGLLLDGHLGPPQGGSHLEHTLERDVVGQVGRDHFGEKG